MRSNSDRIAWSWILYFREEREREREGHREGAEGRGREREWQEAAESTTIFSPELSKTISLFRLTNSNDISTIGQLLFHVYDFDYTTSDILIKFRLNLIGEYSTLKN